LITLNISTTFFEETFFIFVCEKIAFKREKVAKTFFDNITAFKNLDLAPFLGGAFSQGFTRNRARKVIKFIFMFIVKKSHSFVKKGHERNILKQSVFAFVHFWCYHDLKSQRFFTRF
jgi:hypothetical protein